MYLLREEGICWDMSVVCQPSHVDSELFCHCQQQSNLEGERH